jgi:SRSO17 transposase
LLKKYSVIIEGDMMEKGKKERKEYIKELIDGILNDEEKITHISNQLIGGIEAIQSVHDALYKHDVDKEILRKHINKIIDEFPTKECPKCEAQMTIGKPRDQGDIPHKVWVCNLCGYYESIENKIESESKKE